MVPSVMAGSVTDSWIKSSVYKADCALLISRDALSDTESTPVVRLPFMTAPELSFNASSFTVLYPVPVSLFFVLSDSVPSYTFMQERPPNDRLSAAYRFPWRFKEAVFPKSSGISEQNVP